MLLKPMQTLVILLVCALAACSGGGGGTLPMSSGVNAPGASAPSGPTGAVVAPVAAAAPSASGAPTGAGGSTPLPGGAVNPSTGTVVTLSAAITNAQDYPISFTPFAPTSPFNSKISAHPTLLASSAAIVSNQFPGGQNSQTIRANEAGVFDYGHPRLVASATDPVVNVHCTLYCGAPDNGGVPATIHIPAVARPAGGQDSHIDVVQPDGTDITMWGVSKPSGNWQSGQTIAALNIANCGSVLTGQGWLPNGPGPTAAGYCTNAGIITAAELIAGQINHAIIITGECAIGAQYPAENGASTQQCSSGVGPPLGGREWYDVPCATTQANGALKPWEKAILCALNVYGGYMGDNGGGGVHFTGTGAGVEDEEPWYDFNGPGYTSPFAPLAAQGWSAAHVQSYGAAVGTRWIGASPWNPSGVDFPNHIHWLAPCSAQGTC
jgi:hypothetical protein